MLLVHFLLLSSIHASFHTLVPIITRSPPFRQEIRVQILDTEEPVDVLEKLRDRYNQTKLWRKQLTSQVCKQVTCHRLWPIVYSLQVSGSDKVFGKLELLEDDSVQNVVMSFCARKSLRRIACDNLIEAVCQKTKNVNVRCNRWKTSLSEEIYGQNGLIGRLEITDTMEPIDSIYRFIVDHSLELEAMTQLKERICARTHCFRKFPLVYDQNISIGPLLKRLQIPFDAFPIDAVALFAAEHGLSSEQQAELLQAVCRDRYVRCEREVAMQTEIELEDGVSLGSLQIRKHEELADAVYRFGTAHNLTQSIRNSLFQTLCGQKHILCTRRAALLHSIPVHYAEDELGIVKLYEDQELVDAVFDFAAAYQLSASIRERYFGPPVLDVAHCLLAVCSDRHFHSNRCR